MALLDHNPEPQPRRRWLTWRKTVLALLAIVVLLIAIAAVYLNTDAFRERLRAGVVAQLEDSTGGRVEIKALRWSWSTLTVVVDGLTIHGLEAPTEVPYFHADQVTAKLRIVSLLSRKVALDALDVQHPVAHYINYPDGTTNVSKPKAARATGNGMQQVLDLAVGHARAADGMLILNERQVPFDLHADDVVATLGYAGGPQRYDGQISSAKIDFNSTGLRPFSGRIDAAYSIFADRIEISRFSATTGHSSAEGTGTITNFDAPLVTLNYHSSVDLRDVAAVIRDNTVPAGVVDANGVGRFAMHRVETEGKFTARGVAVSSDGLLLRDIAAGSDYKIDLTMLRLPHLFVHALGGSAKGSAQIENWTSLRANSRPLLKGSANAEVSGIAVRDVTRAVSTRTLPLGKANLQGNIAGPVDVAWVGSLRDLIAHFNLNITPAVARDGALPLSGSVQGTYSAPDSELEVTSYSLSTPASHAEGSGVFGTTRGTLKVNARTSDIGELAPTIDALRAGEPLPLEMTGQAAFNGNISGRFKAPSVAGHLDAQNVTMLVPRASAPDTTPQNAAAAPPLRVPWDSISADVVYGPSRASVTRGVLRRGNSAVAIDGSIGLTKGAITDASPIQARVSVSKGSVANFESLAGFNYPVDGLINLNVDVAGTRGDPRANGDVTILNATAYGESIRSIRANVALANNEVQVRNIVANAELGNVTGAGTYNFTARQFRFEAHGQDFRLEHWRWARRPKVSLAGTATFDATGSGTVDAPVFNATARVHDLTLNNTLLGDVSFDAVTRGAEMHATAHAAMQAIALNMVADVHLRGDMPGRADLTLSSTNLNSVVSSFIPVRMTGPTGLDGQMHVEGPFRDPQRLAAKITIAQLSTELEGVTIANAGPIEAHVANEVLSIDRFRLAGEGNRFLNVEGTAELTRQQRLNVRADGDINLRLLQSINTNVVSSGEAVFNIQVGGTIFSPRMNGQLNLRNGAVALIDLPNGLSELNGTLNFNEDRLQIQQLRARTGGGMLDLGGFITYDRGIAFNLTAHGRDIRIRYPEGVSSTATADLSLIGTLKSSVLSGDVTVTRFGLTQQFDFATYLARSKEPVGSGPAPNLPLNNVRLDVHVVSAPELQVQTSLMKVTGNADLHVRGTATRPSILGRLNIVEGRVDFNGTTYTVERGDITFANPITVDPILDVDASAHVRDYDITIGFHGSPLQNKLAMTYRSDPPLPPGDIIALLALGRTRNEAENPSTLPGSQQQAFSDTTSNALLGQAINATISNRVQKIFGVSRVKIDPQVGGTENAGYARLTVDQQISNKVTLTYITNLSQSAQQIIQFEYNVNRNVSIIAVRDQNGIVAIDVRLRQRKR